MARLPHTESDVFVVRMWHERSFDARGEWRASVTHVSTGERRYFTSYPELVLFLDRWRTRTD